MYVDIIIVGKLLSIYLAKMELFIGQLVHPVRDERMG